MVIPRVSAAQARNGTLFNVSKIDGNAAYRTLMAQIQQDLKGDRYVNPTTATDLDKCACVH